MFSGVDPLQCALYGTPTANRDGVRIAIKNRKRGSTNISFEGPWFSSLFPESDLITRKMNIIYNFHEPSSRFIIKLHVIFEWCSRMYHEFLRRNSYRFYKVFYEFLYSLAILLARGIEFAGRGYIVVEKYH